MKKASSLLIVLSGFLSSMLSYGQRSVDLSVMLNTPANGATLPASQPFNFQMLLANNGPDTLKATDTIVLYVTMDTSATPIGILLNGQSTSTFGTTGSIIPPNAGGQVPFTMAFAAPPTAGAHSLCINAAIRNRSADSVRDNAAGNNKACNNITVTTAGTSIAGIAGPEVRMISVYPNPASASVTVRVELTRAVQARISLLDITGRTVHSERCALPAGPGTVVLDVSSIPAGIYSCKMQIGSATLTERLVVAH